MARLSYPNVEELPPELAEMVRQRRGLNVYRMLSLSNGSAAAFMRLSDTLRHSNSLDPQLRELAILRVGHHYGADYELHHHTMLARAAGMRDELVLAAQTGPGSAGLSEVERLVLELADDLLRDGKVSDAGFARARTVFSEAQVADLVLTTGFYVMVCCFLGVFQVDIEQPDAGS